MVLNLTSISYTIICKRLKKLKMFLTMILKQNRICLILTLTLTVKELYFYSGSKFHAFTTELCKLEIQISKANCGFKVLNNSKSVHHDW